ncbi:hypothetical protein E3Q22_00091 [Wallemia mellicola]|uniref:Uncharacterized protein n=1 Tax=Wallemia mellicola TaxID=1708541 RepID=A0A4T0SJ57_9BASI|nr:hypothetical protein E3Q24_00382 [Wallemia mellicola]TIB79547.1 hypothetical protein E3Q23_00088 [Wallemia mellicola]TIB82646.1 hypothetical protein E3Q22_00091 [Wallemia mellicola]TIB89483.1 hypothetical protein E3Q21_00540 [Wallemia mellicola]TIB91841.1 hypothetical protein E3Q20_00526 [Wallemia mellicola]
MEQLFYPEAINKREGMRRKSSASNLLSTLGTSSTSGRSRQGSDPIENIALNDNDGMDLLKDTIVRRIKSFKLMRMAYEGQDLEHTLDDYKMAKRTNKFLILGLSLSYHLDNHQPSDFVKSLSATLSEFDNIEDENFKPKIKNLFKMKQSKKGASNDGSGSNDITYLTNPNIPFQLSYFEVIYTLCDILVQIYCKLSSILGSTMANSSPLSPMYSISPTNYSTSPPPPPQLPHLSSQPSSTSLHSLASAQTNLLPFTDGLKRQQSSSTLKSDLGVHTFDQIWKTDGKLKKILITLTKDLNDIARQAIKDELYSLDPSIPVDHTQLPNQQYTSQPLSPVAESIKTTL